MWTFYAPSVDPTMGTSLPASPVDGQEFTLVDSMSAPTYFWKLRYVAAKSSNKWVCIGGTPFKSEVTTAQDCTTDGYADLATTGPDFTTPVAGDWDITVGFSLEVGTRCMMSYAVGATAAAHTWCASGGDTLNTLPVGVQRTYRHTGIAASTLFRAKYSRFFSGVTTTFKYRVMYAMPVALGG